MARGAARSLDLVVVLDVSPSMRKSHEHMKPSKLSVAKDALAYAVTRLLENAPGTRVGLVAFYGYAYPVLPLTSDSREFVKAIAAVTVAGSGSAPGSGVLEAVKLLRRSVREKRVLLVTDGGFNEGVRLDHAALYARNTGVRVDIVTIGEEPRGDRAVIEATIKLTRGIWAHATTKQELYKALARILGL